MFNKLQVCRPGWLFIGFLFFLLCFILGCHKQKSFRSEVEIPEAVPDGARKYYTADKIKILAKNIKDHDWARKQRDKIINRANKWLKYDDEKLRTLVPPPQVPRAILPHNTGVRVEGVAVSPSSWSISFDKPWKLTSPDGKVYPSNDFEAFMRSGFKDRSLLTGPFPDDGWGCVVQGKEKAWFIAYYAHQLIRSYLVPAVQDLSAAYLITNDRRYAHACALLLWQLAEYYPEYFYEKQSRRKKIGRALYHTWEAHRMAQTMPLVYDAVRPAIQSDEALAKLTGRTAPEICTAIEERLLRTMVNDIMDGSGRILGNFGLHQVALLRLSTVLRGDGRKPTSAEMIAWIISNPAASGRSELMGIAETIENVAYRDGYLLESPGYNRLRMTSLAELLEELDEGLRLDYLGKERFRRMFMWPVQLICAGEFFTPLGDTHDFFHTAMWHPATPMRRDIYEAAWRWYNDPVFAKVLLNISDDEARDLFREPVSDEKLRKAAARHPAPLGVTSELLPGVGFATLQTGNESNRTAVAILYGYYAAHSHWDRLGLNIYSWRNAVLPELGMTCGTDDSAYRHGFVSHTVSHNTVMINSRRQKHKRGRLHVFDSGPFVKIVEVSAEACYPQVAKLYRRTLMLIDAAPDKAYVVDIFRVRGGSQHDWIVHGPQAGFSSEIDFSNPRPEGTLAGKDVSYGYFYDDPQNTGQKGYFDYEGSGFQWLFNVQEASLKGMSRVDWHLNRPVELYPYRPTAGVVLRAYLAPDSNSNRLENLYACDGRPRRIRKTVLPETVKFLVRRRVGDELESVFVTVFEPYKNTPFIQSVRQLPVAPAEDLPVALEIAFGEKRHIVFSRLESHGKNESVLNLGSNVVINARAAVLEQTTDGRYTQIYLLDNNGSSNLPLENVCLPMRQTKVKSVNYEKGEIVLNDPIMSTSVPTGSWAIVESANHANAVQIVNILGSNTFTVGRDDLCAAVVHAQEVNEKGVRFLPLYIYFVEPGMSVVNEDGCVIGRIRSITMGKMELEEPALTLDDFPDMNNDGRRTARLMVVGNGDYITLHYSLRTARK